MLLLPVIGSDKRSFGFEVGSVVTAQRKLEFGCSKIERLL